jgi:hypothetical protein
MARNVLFLLGAGSIGWAMLCLFAGSVLPDWMGLSSSANGELYIESLAINVGMWTALGIFGILGAMFLVCSGGIAAGRILALVQGAKPGVYTGIALALEVSMVVMASAAYISEKTRLAREAKELKKAEKAALEAALAAEHADDAEAAPSPSPLQQP